MSIHYCCLLTNSDNNILLAESTTKGISEFLKLSIYFKDIKKGKATGKFLMDKDSTHYLKCKNIIFIVITDLSIEEDKPERFLDYFVHTVLREFGQFENVTKVSGEIIKYQHQGKLVDKLNSLVKSFGTHLYNSKKKVVGIETEIAETKMYLKEGIKKALQNNEDLGELLLTTDNVLIGAEIYAKNAKDLKNSTKCCRPWIVVTIVIISLIAAYLIIALLRCGVFYNFWCSDD